VTQSELRLETVKFIRENNETLFNFRDPMDVLMFPDMNEYLDKLENTNIFGSQLTLMALHQSRNLTICLMDCGYDLPVTDPNLILDLV
jgi:hypothetical protein